MAEINPHLADNLRRLMGMHRAEQAEVAQAVGITKQGLWQIASGRNMPRWTTVQRLADVFGVTVGDLLAPAEDAVLAGARAFSQAPIRTRTRQAPITDDERATINRAREATWSGGDVLQLRPPEGLTPEEQAQWYREQGAKPPKSGRRKRPS